MSVVEARNLTKYYPTAPEPAVAGIDFAVEQQECFGFLGPNGAGKTTTMRMISCRAQRSGGDLSVLGKDPSVDERVIKERIGVTPQETNVDSVLSVEENLLVYAGYFGINRTDAARRAHNVLEFVQLSDRKNWNTEALSGGMKRRLLIARGLINDPDLLILDEPTTGLDPQARHLVWEKLRDLKRRGVTLIITTHYMEEAAVLCDRLVIMHQGRILVEGSPSQLIAEHVAPEVVELTAGDEGHLVRIASELNGRVAGHEMAGDRLILHVDGGEALLRSINEAGFEYESAMLRRATLEDVFLKLTGRGLDE